MKSDDKNNKKFIDPDNVEVIKDNKKVLKKRGNNNRNKNNKNNYKKNNYNRNNNNYHKEIKEPKIIKKPKIIDDNEKIIIKPKELDIIDNNEELHVFEDYNENDIILNFNESVDTDSIVKEAIKKEKKEKENKIEVKEEIKVKEEVKVKEEIKEPKNKKSKKKKSHNYSKVIITIILLICLGTFGYSIYNIVLWKIDTENTEEVYNEIQSKVTMTETVIETPSITEPVTESVEEHVFNPYYDYIETNMLSVDISELVKENRDTTGWVKLEGTSINYPFVRSSDNDYYLTHSFNKSYNVSGWIFLDYRNDKDLTKNKNSIIYGHRRTDRAMFGSLKNVLTKDWQKNTNNHYIKISLEHYNLLYKVFSIYHIPVTSDYIQTDFNNDKEYLDFLNMLKNRSAYNFYTDVNEKDTILTLSSCYGTNERVVVHAKLIQKQGK